MERERERQLNTVTYMEAKRRLNTQKDEGLERFLIQYDIIKRERNEACLEQDDRFVYYGDESQETGNIKNWMPTEVNNSLG